MSKRVLLDFRGVINEIVDPGQEFEVYDGPDATCKWVTCPHDNVNTFWHFCNGVWISPDIKYDNDQSMKRKVAYGDIGDQLDMLYKDIKAGNLENGSWVSMIDGIKSSIETQAEWESHTDTSKLHKIELHSPSDPAWNYLPESAVTPPKVT